MKRQLGATLAVLLLLSLAAPAIAQFAQRGAIEGFVFDPSGAVRIGANVTLVDLAEKRSRRAATDRTGHFEFNSLAAGQYQVSASAPGFQQTQSEPITVNIGARSRYDFNPNERTGCSL